ncbi:MAG: HlyC/CorC family transporter [Hungatella sp.]|nr:HlyC/CorC family transporter [Hungatella sp.]
MDDGYWPFSILLFWAFILLEAAFYGFTAAARNLNEGNLEHEKENGNKKAERLLQIKSQPARVVNSIQIVSNTAGMVIGAYILKQWSQKMEQVIWQTRILEGSILRVISVAVIGLLMLVCLVSFGVIIPKNCAAREPEKWAYNLLPFITTAVIVLIPFIWLVTGLSYGVLKLFGIDMDASEDNVTEEEIMSMVNEGHEQGVLEANEAEMITNIFQMNDKEAKDIMTHRVNIVSIDAKKPLGEVIRFILKEGKNSRYPVYEKDINDIIGVLHMKDAVIYAEMPGWRTRAVGTIPGLLRKPHFIPETRNIDSLFREMQSQKIHMEIVVDEYGQTAGIVTMEDILEEIVGNILDEYDAEEEYITSVEDGFVLNGMAPLEETADALGIEFTEEERDAYDTINGFLISKLNRIPNEDEDLEVEYNGYQFKILSVENKMIHSVKATKILEEFCERIEDDSDNK